LQLRYRKTKASNARESAKRGIGLRTILLKMRQWGGTTEECAESLYLAGTVPGTWAALYGPTDEDASAYFESIVLPMYEGVTRPEYCDGSGPLLCFSRRATSTWALDFAEKSARFYCDSAGAKASGHGRTLQKLHLSEAARYEEKAVDALWGGVVQAVPIDGEIVVESTANGTNGKFYDIWQQAKKNPGHPWWPIFYRWFEDIFNTLRVSEEQAHEIAAQVATGQGHQYSSEEQDLAQRLAAEGIILTAGQWAFRRAKRDELGQKFFEQYPEDDLTCFLTSGRLFFDGPTIDRLSNSETRGPIETVEHGEGWIFEHPVTGRRYTLSSDVAQGEAIGENSDLSTITITDTDAAEDVFEFMGRVTPDVLGKLIDKYGRKYNNAIVAPERNGHGFQVITTLRELKYPKIYQSEADGGYVDGWITSTKTRQPMLDSLDEAIRKGYFVSHSSRFYSQARTFVVKKNGKPEHADGKHDDLVMCKAINWAVRTSAKSTTSYAAAI
jgi:hypothetical protein